VYEDIFAAIFTRDEAETLLGVEELDSALALANDLGRHSAATAAGATRAAAKATRARTAAEAAAITAAKAAAARSATAEAAAVTTAKAAAITAAHEGIETFFAEPVALVPAPAATPSVKTHKPEKTFVSPRYTTPGGADESRQTTNRDRD
jgi:hypothetical protein